MHIKPTPTQFAHQKSLPRNTPLTMLNLIRLNPIARYPNTTTVTGLEAFQRYSELSAPLFQRVGGEVIWRGAPSATVIGPSDEAWHIAFIVRYPNAAAFFELATDPAYAQAFVHREAGVADSRLIRCELARETGENAFLSEADVHRLQSVALAK